MPNHIKVFPLDESPGFILHRLDTTLAAGLLRTFHANGYDLTPEQWGVLSRLWEEEGVHQSLLAERVGKDRPNVTRILSLLERNGWVRKKADRTDKRRFNVYLTPKGKKLREQLTPIVVSYVESIMEGLSDDDLAAMRRIHLHMLQNAENISGNGSEGDK